MSHTVDSPIDAGTADSPLTQGDSFRLSILLLVGVTLFQRLIGLVRNVLFCGLLEAHELGRWSVASNFLGWAAPFVVLGLPGSFGRLSEHYRHQGQLRVFLRRTGATCSLLLLAAMLTHVAFPAAVAKVVFNDPQRAPLAILLGAVLASLVVLNFLTEFLTSVRLTRAVSLMHVTNSLVFTGLGVLLITLSEQHEASLLIAYGSSSAVAALLGLVYTIRLWRALPAGPSVEPHAPFWRRVASLATWIWCGNTIANLFDVSDQLVLKHFSDLPPGTVDAMLGQLYAGRVVPVLIVAVAVMVAGSLLPYLIKDAETGRHDAVTRRMNAVMKFSSVGFTLVAALTHLASPILFTWILRGKYDSGLHLMPWAFVQYTWFSLSVIANKYLICTDRPRLGLLPLLLSLIVGVALTVAMAPRFGLLGVVLATATANALGLVSLLHMTQRCGMPWERGVWIAAVLPLSMALGGGASLAITIVLLAVSAHADWLISGDERRQLASAISSFWNQFNLRRRWGQKPAT